MLTLYDYYRSSACFRVRIALNIKRLNFQCIPVHLLNNGGEQNSNTYKNINPQSLVPTLSDEDHTLTQSLAIIEYLNDIHPSPPLLPDDAYEKALVRAFALSITADIHPLNNLRVLNFLQHELHISDEQKQLWYKHWISLGLTALEQQLCKANVSGKYCFGDTFTMADICLVPQLFNARRYSCDLSAYPTLVRIDTHCQDITAVTDAWPIETA